MTIKGLKDWWEWQSIRHKIQFVTMWSILFVLILLLIEETVWHLYLFMH